MIWFMVFQVIATLVELVRLGRRSESEKDLEILLLRRQLAIYERKQAQPMRLSRSEKVTLVVLATKLKAQTGRTIKAMSDVIRIVIPATLIGWHKQVVRWKWTYRNQKRGGRPRTDREIEQLVVRLARLILLNERHLRCVLQEYVTYYNVCRPHQGLEQDSPLGLEAASTQGPIRCRNVLGGIIRDYYREAA